MLKRTVLFFLTITLFSVLPLFGRDTKTLNIPTIPGTGPEAIDGTGMLKEREEQLLKGAAEMDNGPFLRSLRSVEKNAETGDEITISIGDFYYENSYDETFTVVKVGTNGIILVTKEAYESFDGTAYHFANPVGDGSGKFKRKEDILTTTQLDYLLDEFDRTIYPGDTAVFGEPLPRGTEGKKIWILLHNIKDASYYVEGEESYVAGYFSAGEDMQNNKNMMHIDTYDWINRVGAESENPFLYEGVFAHELEHLIHFDRDSDEPSWIDEGLADLAGYICGYGHPVKHVAYYLVRHPITPLTFWGSGLEDYGASYLFALYLYEKFGGNEFVTALIREQANGIEGVNNTLAAFGYDIDFDQVYNNWTVANYLDDSEICEGQYGYTSLEMGSADTLGYTIASALEKFWEVTAKDGSFDLSSDWTGINPAPYTPHYVSFHNEWMTKSRFNGDDFVGVLAVDGEKEWYSGASAWAFRSFSRDFEIPAEGANLTFQTYFEIEENWDYGYVEVYSHDTGEWYTAAAEGLTTNTLPNIQDNPNTPLEREPSTYLEKGRWNAFTGNSAGWKEVTMDLNAFAGQTISLYFTTWQDGAFTLQMMYVDKIVIEAAGFADSGENGPGEWTMNEWEITDGKKDNTYSITNLLTYTFPEFDDGGYELSGQEVLFDLSFMCIDSEKEKGKAFLYPAPRESGLKNISIISNLADHILPSGYIFKVK